MVKKTELAKLKARGTELEARIAKLEADAEAAAAPKPAFVPEPPWHYDPTANMSMPPSALREMVAAVPDHMLRDIVHDNRAPTGRPGVIPGSQQPASPRPSAGDGTGWAREIPIGLSPHQRYVDAQLDAQDAKDRQERIQQVSAADTARKVAERSERLQTLIEQNRKLMERL